MPFDPTLGSIRDRVMLAVGDTGAVSGFPHLSMTGDPLLPGLNDALYDAYINAHGPRRAAALVLTRVLEQLPSSWTDGETSEKLDSMVAAVKEVREDILSGRVDVEGSGSGTVIGGRVAMTKPDMGVYRDL